MLVHGKDNQSFKLLLLCLLLLLDELLKEMWVTFSETLGIHAFQYSYITHTGRNYIMFATRITETPV